MRKVAKTLIIGMVLQTIPAVDLILLKVNLLYIKHPHYN